ncbi:hypothetical protein DDB_G0269762 [Dictyostelium discoideum AX4]|uniref:Ribosomal protein S18 n=1 Tax=Dictyostelium discoideum TaxID=44689 RepID=Q55D72_DICDI|nr:hypothetical protein DDB_G0269762 [Dictyostelium discoideum AX4]EAL72231.1 hypothetical protein DDB_G0269762 [Dictyostelium discoideum AX4]|eukprot:XP_646259.1 hypothetical protein DDB_G0269762 [Dictyostelium discoideum AX4]
MQSIIRLSIKNKNLFLKNKGQISITRNYCNDHSGNHDHSISFEKFKENRELIKKKSELIKEITKSRLLGQLDTVNNLQQQVSSIENALDPKIEQFSIQSKEQKEAELQLWKRFLEKKGVVTRSQLASVNKFEFERFKANGLLDAEAEKLKKDKEKEFESKRPIDETTGMKIPIHKVTQTEKIRYDPILRDAFPSPLVADQKVGGIDEEIDQLDEEDHDEEFSLENKESKIKMLIEKMEDQSNKDPQFKLMVMNFLDDGIPLKDKLIFRDDFEISAETLKSFSMVNEADDDQLDSQVELSEKEKKVIGIAQQKILDLQIKEIAKDYKFNSSLEQKRLDILFRNNTILRYKAKEAGAIQKDGSIDMKKLLQQPLGIEDLTRYSLDFSSENSGNYIYQDGQLLKQFDDGFTMPYEKLYEEDVKSQKKLDKLKSAANKLICFTNGKGSAREVEEILEEFSLSEMDALHTFIDMFGSDLVEYSLNLPSEGKYMDAVYEYLENEKERRTMMLGDSFRDHVTLSPNEAEEFPTHEIMLPEDRVLVTKEDSPMVKAFKDRVIQEGLLNDFQTKIDLVNDQPQYESHLFMEEYKAKLYENEKQLQKDLLETRDPMMIRNFIKYKYDQQKELLDQKKEQEYNDHTSTMNEIVQEVSQGSLSNIDPPIYHPVTGKLFTPKKKNPKCLLCQNPNWQVDPLNTPFLSIYLNKAGDMLPRHFSGNCLKHQKKIVKTIRQAKSLGIFSYKNGTFTIYNPNVYSLTNQELEEYNKWLNGTYTKEELQQVYDEYEASKELRFKPTWTEAVELPKGKQQEKVLMEFGMENNDLNKVYGKDKQ